MLRSMMQVYVKDSCLAVELYRKAFNAKVVSEFKNDNGTYLHAELDVFGQILAISEIGKDKITTGDTMQFCLHFKENEREIIEKAYDILQDGAKILVPLGPCFFASCMTDFIDKFGVRWCLFA